MHGDVGAGLCVCYVGGPACMAAHRGLHERGHGCACTCVEGCACRRVGPCVSVRVNTGTLRGREAGGAGGALLSGWGGFYSFQGWQGRQGLCVWLSGYPAQSSRPGSLFPAPNPAQAWHPPVPWHQSRQRRRSQNPLQAGGKGDMDGVEVAAGVRREECPASHTAPPQRPIPSAPRWATAGRRATHIAHFDPAELLQQPPFDLRPQRAGRVEAGAGRALLAAVLEGRAQGPTHHAVHVGRAVHKVKVLAPAL